MPETSCEEISTVNPIDRLPLRLLRSEIVPPAPTRSTLTIDWLPDFAGYSWLAYGASTLLVISHLPSPLCGDETLNGPVFRQIFKISSDVSSPVNCVSWSPVTPSVGELGAASGNSVCLFSRDPDELNGSFCWSQNAILVQATKVEAFEWTGSGDGIIVCGTEVVLWKRRNRSWEKAWKFMGDRLQDLVSSTWSIDGPFATATSWIKLPSECDEAGKCVSAFYNNGKSYGKVDLRHPQRISMIQWRPMSVRQCTTNVKYSVRNVLMTCCLDGTVRLWCEIDDGKSKKGGKDVNDHKTSFCVAAVIEIDRVLGCHLGRDAFMVWATQIGGIFKTMGGTNQLFPVEEYEHENVGKCEWLIGYGPAHLVTLWAIHCLDDISPMRFPRVTLWKRQELQGIGVGPLSLADAAGSPDGLPLEKVVICRKYLYSPPYICSLVHLSPRNTILWSSLHTKNSRGMEVSSPDKSSLSQCMQVMNLDGHSGKILQVAFHPIFLETEFAVSLDSNGLLLFWSSSTTSCWGLDHPISIPFWKLNGRFQNLDSSKKYTSICWAPPTFKDERFLLMGHVRGIDCFVVRICGRGQDNFLCRYICTIKFAALSPLENGPASISAIPLPSSCGKTFELNRFLLLSVCLNDGHFNALSWKITLHHFDLLASSCECDFHDRNNIESGESIFQETIASKRYCIHVSPSSSELPESHKHDQVTSFAVVCPSWCTLENDINCKNPVYAMATGQADGCLKLWRSNSQEPSALYIPWELVGMLTVGQNPVNAIALTNSRGKIATMCRENHPESVSTISIWEPVHLIDSGVFILEEKLSTDAEVIAIKWSDVGNDQLLLGVCTRNEMQVYAQQRCGGQTLLVSNNSCEAQIWQCIAFAPTFSAVHDFFWGPKGTAALIHTDHVILHSQWLSLIDRKQKTDNNPNIFAANLPSQVGGMDEGAASAVFCDSGINDLKEAPTVRRLIPSPSKRFNVNDDYQSSNLLLTSGPYGLDDTLEMSSMEITEKLRGSLPLYHPQALLAAIYSGNWQRAHAALRHLAGNVISSDAHEKGLPMKSSHYFPDILLSQYYEGRLSNGPNMKDFQLCGTTGSMTQTLEFQTGLQLTYNMESNASNGRHSLCSADSEFSGLSEQLEKFRDIGCISSIEKIQILAIVDLLGEVSNPRSTSVYSSLDEAGRRFWVAFRFKQLFFARRFSRTASMEELAVDSTMIGWAFHSDCQENLFDTVLRNESSWQEMRTLGVGFWYSNVAQLRSRMERLARQQYLKNKNPKDCAMLYIALNRIQVLAGLFKLSKDEKDKPLVGFLSRNFQEEKNKAAALKNAYVLMGKHQLELAVGFFLLGGDTSSAVNVCMKNLCDEQLALIICRLVEGQGGPLECNLITKYILPAAVQRGDFWLAGLLEWELGLYSRSFLAMVGCLGNPISRGFVISNQISFMDPSIGLYCLMLANKNSMKNAVGERNAATLSRWATLMAATAFSRCGLPLEALECLSTSVSSHVGTDQASISSSRYLCTPYGILESAVSDSSNWLSFSVSSTLHTHARLGLAIQFLSKILQDHPDWPVLAVATDGTAAASISFEIDQSEKLADFQNKLEKTLDQFYQRFSLSSSCLINMVLSSLCNCGLISLGYSIAQRYSSSGFLADEPHMSDRLQPCAVLCESVLETTEDISWSLSHFIAVCGFTCLQSASCDDETKVFHGIQSKGCNALRFYFQGILRSILSLRASIRLCFGSSDENVLTRLTIALDLVEYCMQLALVWVQGDIKQLFRMVQPLMIANLKEQAPCEVDVESLKKAYIQKIDVGAPDEPDAGVASQMSKIIQDKQVGYPMFSFPEDERCLLIQACFWKHISSFVKQKLASISVEIGDGIPNSGSINEFVPQTSNRQDTDNGEIVYIPERIMLVLAKMLSTILAHISSHHVKQLAIFLKQKIEKRIRVRTLLWLHECRESQSRTPNEGVVNADTMNRNKNHTVLLMLWNLCVDPNLLHEAFLQEDVDLSCWFYLQSSRDWSDVFRDITGENEQNEPHNRGGHNRYDSSGDEVGSPGTHASPDCSQKDTKSTQESSPFQNPKEVYKRNGELIEVLCINTINHRQAAIASNRKGIIFFNREDGEPYDDQSDHIWSDADWPHNGWANSESTPIPTCVSLGVGLGSKKGAHLGLGGATVGVVSLAKPGKASASGGASYAGFGASGLGWETQEDFEQFVDPPPTLETVSTTAFSSHPSMSLFLVGSSNTHIYLWEFGKDTASATYGVLPAANVPPPYALASVSAVQFGPCGHRFASAALDGTVCTWQLEVGGRSNIHPVESYLCFNNHASDVKYISSSGSIVAASGYSSNGANIVVWDTLAPPTTSQASILCHEGGARSVSVFDNDIGSGSISPIIVTGGRNGDIGLHDFRYIATGKAKRHRNFENREANARKPPNDTQAGGDQNPPGMLWYIPKAHLGSVTKISTIPGTSLFLTGSKDGDVKIWDAKAAKLVHHWPKLHERHTFLQPSSRGYGGIIRAGVTDIQVCSDGFLSCGGDGTVKFIGLKDHHNA